jgi:hypothetical protein
MDRWCPVNERVYLRGVFQVLVSVVGLIKPAVLGAGTGRFTNIQDVPLVKRSTEAANDGILISESGHEPSVSIAIQSIRSLSREVECTTASHCLATLPDGSNHLSVEDNGLGIFVLKSIGVKVDTGFLAQFLATRAAIDVCVALFDRTM